jgi:FKBP-type peptidyl-prolyl cis-trans isomerase
MIKRVIPIALLGMTVLSACHSGSGDFKNVNGIEYKIVKDAPGDMHPKVGDFASINIKMYAGDSLLADSRKLNDGKPVEMQVQEAKMRGDWAAALTQLTPGDSAIFRVKVDSLKKFLGGQPLPPFMKAGTYLKYQISLVSVKTAEDYKKEQDAKLGQQKDIDDKTLQDYFAKNNIKANKTADGLYYTIQSEGSGNQLKAGDTAYINYTGKTMDGKVFDSNTDPAMAHGRPMKPLQIPVGAHMMIPGMDEGIALLKKGSKATLYLPSGLAYGPASPGPGIGPNSILMFDVEVKDVKSPK